jgi:hypothetical protein
MYFKIETCIDKYQDNEEYMIWVVVMCSLVQVHFTTNNQERFLSNSAVHIVNTRNKHNLHRPLLPLHHHVKIYYEYLRYNKQKFWTSPLLARRAES